MSISSRKPTPGPRAAAPAGPRNEPTGTRDMAGLLLARLTVTPALLAASFLLASFPLLMIGWFKAVPVIAISLVAAAVIVPLGLRRVPGLTRPDPVPAGHGNPAQRDDRRWALPGASPKADGRTTPWWTLVSLIVIAVAYGIHQAIYHSQFLVLTRDPASYMQVATWLAGHGSLPVNPDLAAFGGDRQLWFQSYATYTVGHSVVLQFLTGLPMVLAVGYWLGGVSAALLMAPLLGAAGVLTFGGLVARLAGARWAPLAALILAVSLPQQFTSRSTYSETLAQVLFLGGLALVIDSLRAAPGTAGGSVPSAGRSRSLVRRIIAPTARWDAGRVLAFLAGLAFGVSLLVRLDAPADVLPLIPYCGLLLIRRQRQAVPLLIGLVIGWAYGVYDGLAFTRPYVMKTNITSVKPMVELVIAATVATAIGMLALRRGLRRRGSLPRVGERWWLPRWLPAASTVLPFIVLGAFGLRSHFQKDYAKEQFAQLSLHWVYWYIGGPAIAIAGVGAAVLMYGCIRGRWPAWSLPLATFAWVIVVFLYRPAITPDQPWASRRLVPAVLPGFILLAVWAVAWATGRIRESRGASEQGQDSRGTARGWRVRTLTSAGLAALCAVAFLAPTVVTSFGLSFHEGGPVGVRVVAHGLAVKRTYTGQVAALYGLCARLPADSSVIIVDGFDADRLGQVVRGMCDVPVARFHDQSPHNDTGTIPEVRKAISDVERVGRRPVLLASARDQLNPYKNGTVTRAMTMRSTMDEHIFLDKPLNIRSEDMDVWMWEPTR